MLIQLGRYEEAQTKTQQIEKTQQKRFGGNDHNIPCCKLILASLSLHSGYISTSRKYHGIAYDWALARDAKQVLCWSALVKARIEIKDDKNTLLQDAQTAITEGLKIARECGYGIYHTLGSSRARSILLYHTFQSQPIHRLHR